MKTTFSTALAMLSVSVACASDPSLPGLIYHPENDAIALRNGTRWDNRPLYCHERFSFYWTGEMPGLRGEAGVFRFGIERSGKRLMLDRFSERVMRYRPGWIEWECRDETFPGLTVSVAATTLADGNGITARIALKGAKPGDKALWLPKAPPSQVQLGTNCRAMVYGLNLRPGVELKEVSLVTLSLDVVIGLMG